MMFSYSLNNRKGDFKMRPMDELNKLSYKLPKLILDDIDKRITDWLASGGSENDPYIDQQLRFAKNYLDKYQKVESK